MKLVIWIHGIQNKDNDFSEIRDCMDAVNAMLPAGQYLHHFFNWDSIVGSRQELVYKITSQRGNFLCNQGRKLFAHLGLDLWMYLQTRKFAEPGDWYFDIHSRLADEINKIRTYAEQKESVEICFVAHSWGTKIAIDYAIDHPEDKFTLVTMGSPLPVYGSATFRNWGEPSVLEHIKWVNISLPNDPISSVMRDNPNKNWEGVVKDFEPKCWHFIETMFPVKSHCHYWSCGKVREMIAETLR